MVGHGQPHSTTHEPRAALPRTRRRLAGISLLAVVALVPSACSSMADNTKASAFCSRYDYLVQRAAQFREQNVDPTTIPDLQAKVQRVQDQLAALVAASDGRLSTGYSPLQNALDDLRQSLAANAESRSETRKMIADSFAEVQKQWASSVGELPVDRRGAVPMTSLTARGRSDVLRPREPQQATLHSKGARR